MKQKVREKEREKLSESSSFLMSFKSSFPPLIIILSLFHFVTFSLSLSLFCFISPYVEMSNFHHEYTFKYIFVRVKVTVEIVALLHVSVFHPFITLLLSLSLLSLTSILSEDAFRRKNVFIFNSLQVVPYFTSFHHPICSLVWIIFSPLNPDAPSLPLSSFLCSFH